MQLSLNWLKDFIDLPKKISPQELAKRLTLHTVEVDSIENQADKFKNIVVGKILKIDKHPNADRLRLVKVDIKTEVLDIVCGASNIAAGQKVPVALIGAVLPNGLEIKEVLVRGEKSSGMLCAADELVLGDDHSGIIILDEKAKIGSPLAEHFSLNDVIIEVDNKSITNRPDLCGHYGMAREIAAFLDVELKKYNANPQIYANTANSNNANIKIDAKVEDFNLCPRYMAAAMDGIEIKPSPKWMQNRLIAAGMRPINNIVDITNYAMLELGQPLHAFDAEKIKSAGKGGARRIKLSVRRAKSGETIETLDKEKRKLDDNILVIADKEKPLAIAGIMGGAASEIDLKTNFIIIESANFNFISVRKSSRELGLRTESSMRFEKSLDPNLCETALARAIGLIKELIPPARLAGAIADVKKFKLNQGPIEADLEWFINRIGQKIPEEKIGGILNRLGFAASLKIKVKKRIISARVPTWRAAKDISLPEDLVEEISRIYGYGNIKPAMPATEIQAPRINEQRIIERKIKNILAAAGFAEISNYSFVGEEQLKKLGIDFSDHIKLANPIASNQTLLRQSLAPNLIGNVRTNQARFQEIKLFEIGNIFLNFSEKINKGGEDGCLPYQEKRLGAVIAGQGNDVVFSAAKGTAEYLLSLLSLPCKFAPAESAAGWQDNNLRAKIICAGAEIGIIALLNSDRARSCGIKKETAIFEISLRALVKLLAKQPAKKYQKFDKFPPAGRDLALALNEKILYNDIKKEIAGFNPLIKNVELFDVYSGGKLGRGMKSLAFHIIYQAEDRTLTSEKVDAVQQKLIRHLEKKFEARVRNF